MNTRIFSLSLILAIAFSVPAQSITDTVSTGASYANQVWYNLENGTETSVSGTAWDFGFQISGFSSAILANTAFGSELYLYPNGDTGSWATIDTAGMSNWEALHNSSTTWELGGFNMGIDTSNNLDLGWGKYNFITHHVTGDSLFVWKTAAGNIYKVWIQNLASGTYNFLISDYNGTQVDTIALAKSNFSGKNFGFYSIANDSIIDLEPMSNNWDLVFSKYMEDLGTPYAVSGIRTNKGHEAVKVYPLNNPATYDSASIHNYSSEINIIGYDWKSFNSGTFTYDIQDSTVYFVKTDSTTYWKLVMKDFGGSANGNYIFEKTKLSSAVGVFENEIKKSGTFLLYPNPSADRNISIVADLPASVTQAQVNVLNMNGQLVQRKHIAIRNAFEVHQMNLTGLESGMYFIQLTHDQGIVSKRLILK